MGLEVFSGDGNLQGCVGELQIIIIAKQKAAGNRKVLFDHSGKSSDRHRKLKDIYKKEVLPALKYLCLYRLPF
jgi:hypothetical protein